MRALVFLLPYTVLGGVTLLPRQHNHGDMQPPKASVPKATGPFDKIMSDIVSTAMDWLITLTRYAVPAAKLASTKTVEPKLRPDAVRAITRFGPYTLEAKGTPRGFDVISWLAMDADSQSWLIKIKEGLCFNCTIIAAQGSINDLNGNVLEPKDGVFLHHVLSKDMTKHVPNFISTCETTDTNIPPENTELSNRWGNEFLTIGTDRQNARLTWTTKDGKFPSGYHIGQNDEMVFNVEIVNYNKEKKEFYLTLEFEYLPGIRGGNTQTQLVDINGCDPKRKIAVSTEGAVNTTSGKFQILRDGSIIDSIGHMHDGGVKTYLFINDKFICAVEAVYGTSSILADAGKKNGNSITGVTTCNAPVIPVKAGDWVSMVAEYDLKKHPQRGAGGGMVWGQEEAMGMWGFYFVPSSNSSGIK